jgi:hypothetical protein
MFPSPAWDSLPHAPPRAKLSLIAQSLCCFLLLQLALCAFLRRRGAPPPRAVLLANRLVSLAHGALAAALSAAALAESGLRPPLGEPSSPLQVAACALSAGYFALDVVTIAVYGKVGEDGGRWGGATCAPRFFICFFFFFCFCFF